MTSGLKNIFCWLLLWLSFAVPANAALLNETTFSRHTGVNIHFLDKNIEQHIALLKEAGFGWVRKDLSWRRVEQQKGVYDFSAYDPLIDALNTADINVVLILDYTNPFYDDNLSPYTYDGRRGFANFAAAAAKHFSNKKVIWEIYNEPNWTFWKPASHLENYVALARIVTNALRHAASHQAIIAPALAGPTQESHRVDYQYLYLKMVLQDPIAKKWNAISVHPYRGKKIPEDVFRDVPRLNKLLASNGIKSPIIFSEWGYHTSNKGIDETTQAAYVTRALLITSSLRMPFSIWYNWQEQGSDSSDSEHKYGLIRDGDVDASDEDNKKPAFFAVKVLNALLRDYRFDKIISNTNGIYCMRFKKGTELAYAVWTTGKDMMPYPLELTNGQWEATQLMGDATNITVTNSVPATLQLQSMPLIVKPVINPAKH